MGKDDYLRNPDFYKDYTEVNPALILGLIIISFGLYAINWIYLKNRDFEKITPLAPDSNRGAIIMMIIPFIWFFIDMILNKLFFITKPMFFKIIESFGWIIILFLILKYLYDFCKAFEEVTKTSANIWFTFFVLGLIGIVATAMSFYYLSPFLFFVIIIIPAMQSELNSHFSRFTMKKKGNIFYS